MQSQMQCSEKAHSPSWKTSSFTCPSGKPETWSKGFSKHLWRNGTAWSIPAHSGNHGGAPLLTLPQEETFHSAPRTSVSWQPPKAMLSGPTSAFETKKLLPGRSWPKAQHKELPVSPLCRPQLLVSLHPRVFCWGGTGFASSEGLLPLPRSFYGTILQFFACPILVPHRHHPPVNLSLSCFPAYTSCWNWCSCTGGPNRK